MENQQTLPKRKRRFGDRNDGRRVRTRGPMEGVAAYIMKDRVGSSNYVRDTIEMEPIEEYIRQKRKEGREISLMHLIIAAYVRLVAQRPAINRFISGQKTFTRDDYVEIVLTIKKEMRLDSPRMPRFSISRNSSTRSSQTTGITRAAALIRRPARSRKSLACCSNSRSGCSSSWIISVGCPGC